MRWYIRQVALGNVFHWYINDIVIDDDLLFQPIPSFSAFVIIGTTTTTAATTTTTSTFVVLGTGWFAMSTRFTYATYMSKFTISVFTASKRIESSAATITGISFGGFFGFMAGAGACATAAATTTTNAITIIIIIIIIIIIAKLFCSFS